MTHPYKDILIAIANGEQIQWRTSDGEWIDQSEGHTLREIGTMSLPIERYRIKLKTIRIGKFDVPEPLREAPEDRFRYWLTDTSQGTVNSFLWAGDCDDSRWLGLGLLHTTQEAAQIHLDALLSFTRRSA